MFKIKNRILTEFSGSQTVIAVPDGVSEIAENAFAWSDIVSVIIPKSVRKIGKSAFKSCRKLRSVIIEDGCEEIEESAFASCSQLHEIILPDSVKKIGAGAFADDADITEIRLPEQITVIPERAFSSCFKLSNIVFPPKLRIIGDYAFNSCLSLNKAELPQTLEIIGEGAFKRCSSLEEIVFPASLEEIGGCAFSECTDIHAVFSSSSVKKIGKTVFPDTTSDAPNGIRRMYSTSFLNRKYFRALPEIAVPKSVTDLKSGFDELLSYREYRQEKSNLEHILSLEKFGCKIYIGEKYYPDDGSIIKNGEIDFDFYDSHFEFASEKEKPLIAAVRLGYPVSLSLASREKYEAAVINGKEEAAMFAVGRNDSYMLSAVFSLASLSADYIDLLYDTAYKNRYFGLLTLINSQKSDFDSLFSL